MTIRKAPSAEDIRKFIGEAPDAPQVTPPSPARVSTPSPAHVTDQAESDADQKSGGVIRGNKQVVTVGFTRDLLPHIDAASGMLNISRAAFINMACTRFVKDVYRDYQNKLESRS
jgi:hypothetical protein